MIRPNQPEHYRTALEALARLRLLGADLAFQRHPSAAAILDASHDAIEAVKALHHHHTTTWERCLDIATQETEKGKNK